MPVIVALGGTARAIWDIPQFLAWRQSRCHGICSSFFYVVPNTSCSNYILNIESLLTSVSMVVTVIVNSLVVILKGFSNSKYYRIRFVAKESSDDLQYICTVSDCIHLQDEQTDLVRKK